MVETAGNSPGPIIKLLKSAITLGVDFLSVDCVKIVDGCVTDRYGVQLAGN